MSAVSDPRPNIWQLQIQSDIAGLTKALSFDEVDVRRRAAIALRALGAASSIPALEAALSQEKDDDVRGAIIDALDFLMQDDAKAQQEKIVEHIAKLGSDNHDEIIQAARALGELNDKMASEPLIILFHNSTMPPRVRLAAAEALILLASAPTEVTLLMALRSKDWQTRRRAAAVMGQLRTDWAVEPLTAALKDPNEVVAKTAYAALKRIQTPLPATKPSPEESTASKAKTRPLATPPGFPELSPAEPTAVDQTQPQPSTMLTRLQPEESAQWPASIATPPPSESDPAASAVEPPKQEQSSPPAAPPAPPTPAENSVVTSTPETSTPAPISQPVLPAETPAPTPAEAIPDKVKPPVSAPSPESEITRPTKPPEFQAELIASNSASDEKPQETATLPQTESLKPAGDDAPEN